MTTIIKAADAAEFLALVPRLAGFRPVRSVAIVPFQANRTLGVMRLDLPPDDADTDRVAATLVGMVCKIRDADGLAVVVYTDHGFAGSGPEDGGIAHALLVEAIGSRADACGLRVTDALCVASDAWGSYLDSAPTPHPLSDLADDLLDDRLPDDLRGPLGDQSTGAELPPADLAQRERVSRALRALELAVSAVAGATGAEQAAHADLAALDPQALAAACALDDIPALFEDVLEWDAADLRPYDAAMLIWCLARPVLRDVALVQWCAGIEMGDAALDAQLSWEDGDRYPEEIAAFLWGEGERPEVERLEHALAVVRHAAAQAPRGDRAGALAAASWLCWALGRSTHAGWYAEQAVAIEPGHGLSGILLTMLGAGHLPEWAFTRPVPR
jgi:hypothetical protein